MKFVPVPIMGGPTKGKRVLFSIWDTRVQDYGAFVTETKHDWPKASFKQEPAHPAVNVSWDDAQAFCNWLTAHERKAGKLGAKECYRLPTDHEWSCAVGIGEQDDAAKSPKEKPRVSLRGGFFASQALMRRLARLAPANFLERGGCKKQAPPTYLKRLLTLAAALAILSSRAFAEPHCIVDAAVGRMDAA